MITKQIKLGGTYRDDVHHFTGVATVISDYLTGCARVVLERMVNNELKDYSFDETRLQVKKGGRWTRVPDILPEVALERGGPAEAVSLKSTAKLSAGARSRD